MKFLADMGISLRTVEQLRQQGYDAMHLEPIRIPVFWGILIGTEFWNTPPNDLHRNRPQILAA
jgi:hypothetical protein